ncbi:MAG TPA: two-component system response regulator [Planctomycetaceae bacterium]|nr:two-component system response regulator [Planctomycetaceae bacterium]HRF00178.1 response regulator [Pirellulaceae bacterium]
MDKSLLVVDDALIIRRQIVDAATEAGWNVIGETDDGLKAYEMYRELQPTAVTLDLIMPGHGGIEALERIRGEFPDARIVLVSALNQKEVLKRAFALGAADFVIKPFRPEALIETLEAAVAEAN